MTSFTRKFFLLWLPLFIYCGMIFYLSSRTVVTVSHDKLAHTLEYAILGVLIARALMGTSLKLRWVLLFSPLLGALYGLSDEFHQIFVPGRDSSGWDVLADFIGSSLGVLAYVAIHRLQWFISENR